MLFRTIFILSGTDDDKMSSPSIPRTFLFKTIIVYRISPAVLVLVVVVAVVVVCVMVVVVDDVIVLIVLRGGRVTCYSSDS